MSELPEALFLNPVWHALHGPHRHLAIIAGGACRYPADVAPFAAIRSPVGRVSDELRSLLAPGESVWLIDSGRVMPGLTVVDRLECLQMGLPADAALPLPSDAVLPLHAGNAHEMVALTDAAFPGFFRSATHRMGYYCDVRVDGTLVAMGGERLQLAGYPELSAICTHPTQRGRGLARDVIAHLVRLQRRDGLRSWLHVGHSNTRAIALYTALGFKRVRSVMFHRVGRTD